MPCLLSPPDRSACEPVVELFRLHVTENSQVENRLDAVLKLHISTEVVVYDHHAPKRLLAYVFVFARDDLAVNRLDVDGPIMKVEAIRCVSLGLIKLFRKENPPKA